MGEERYWIPVAAVKVFSVGDVIYLEGSYFEIKGKLPGKLLARKLGYGELLLMRLLGRSRRWWKRLRRRIQR